ncbi:hypothetical protein WKV44_06415 [Spirochaetia bacterium 38H-sp]|uniref:Uncharacterized protein n=1 Tax=Rarispira pelagica TaxID=3141764 RepID=A0ABU9UBX2_9SPIR
MNRINLLLDRFEVIAAFLLVLALFSPWTSVMGIPLSGFSLNSAMENLASFSSLFSDDKPKDFIASYIGYVPVALIAACLLIVILRLMEMPSAVVSLITGIVSVIYTGVTLYNLVSNKMSLGSGIWISLAAAILLVAFSLRKKKHSAA